MAREILPYFNESYGQGLEGTVNYANSIVGNYLIPTFLVALYAVALYVWSKSSYKMSGGMFFISFVFFLMAIIFQTVTTFGQIFIFIFFIGMIVGIVMHFIN
jgi:hypothetical protein